MISDKKNELSINEFGLNKASTTNTKSTTNTTNRTQITQTPDIPDINTSDVCPKNEYDRKCAPGISFEAGSCVTLQILIEMVNAYNKNAGSSAIMTYPKLDTLNPKKYKKYLLSEFNKRMGGKCESQKCWSEQDFVENMKKTARDELQKYTFRPEGPQGKFEWLNTLNITDVLTQSEKKYQNFKYLGTVPIDFDKFERFGFKNLNFGELIEKNKFQIGAVFNLDKHNESGSHWVAMYANLKEGQVLFFDSYGTRPDKRIRAFMRRVSLYCTDVLKIKNTKVDYNKIRHQYGNSECGVYSINFIKRMLRGDTFEDICNSKTSDEKINKCRRVYFGNAE